MSQSINLIPQQEVVEQRKTRLVNLSTVFSIVLLVGIGIASVIVISMSLSLNKELKDETDKVESYRNSIKAMATTEVISRNLFKKYTVLKGLFESRIYFSTLMKELNIRRPSGVLLTDLGLKENTLIISGNSDNYISVAAFMNNLLDKNFQGSSNIEGLFKSVTLTSVSLGKREGSIDFSMKVEIDTKGLKK